MHSIRLVIMNDAKYLSLTHRIAEETQLLAEEKWIIEALNKIKNQRNCLQIERLQLESMKTQLRKTPNRNSEKIKMPESPKPPMTFSLSMMQNMSATKPAVPSTPNRKFLEAETSCNTEELNLGVSHPVFIPNRGHDIDNDLRLHKRSRGQQLVNKNIVLGSKPSEPFIIEEDDEEEEDCDDLLLDMNMFMNCTQKQ